jgi:hypothetical protein
MSRAFVRFCDDPFRKAGEEAYDSMSRLQTLSYSLDGTGTANDVSFGFAYMPSTKIATRNISIGVFAYNDSSCRRAGCR